MASPGQYYGYNAADPDAAANAVALQRAKANARKRNRHEHTSNFTLPLNVKLAAGMVIALQGWGTEFEGNHIIESCHHSIGKGHASESVIRLRKCLKGY